MAVKQRERLGEGSHGRRRDDVCGNFNNSRLSDFPKREDFFGGGFEQRAHARECGGVPGDIINEFALRSGIPTASEWRIEKSRVFFSNDSRRFKGLFWGDRGMVHHDVLWRKNGRHGFHDRDESLSVRDEDLDVLGGFRNLRR